MLAHGFSSFFRTRVPAVAVYAIRLPLIWISCMVFEVVSTAGGAVGVGAGGVAAGGLPGSGGCGAAAGGGTSGCLVCACSTVNDATNSAKTRKRTGLSSREAFAATIVTWIARSAC